MGDGPGWKLIRLNSMNT